MFFSRDSLKALAMLTQMGITMIVPIGLGLFLGAFLDRKLNTAPIFLIVFILLGIAAGFRNIYHMTKSFVQTPAQVEQKQVQTLDAIKKEEAKRNRKGQTENETEFDETSKNA